MKSKTEEKFLEYTSKADGNIHEGQLSVEYGFVPYARTPLSLPPSHQCWDDLAKKIPDFVTYKENIRETLKTSPVLLADEINLPDFYLSRASIILGNLAAAYYYNREKVKSQEEDPLPDCIRIPWETVCKRLNRFVVLSYELKAVRNNFDTFMCNWYVKDGKKSIHPSLITIDDIDLLVPTFGNNEERVFNLSIMLTELRFAAALSAIINLIKALFEDNVSKMIKAFNDISLALVKATEELLLTKPNSYSRNHVDSVTWARTVAQFDTGLPGGIGGVTGNLSPLFHLLDTLIERETYSSKLGEHLKHRMEWLAEPHRQLIIALREDLSNKSLRKYIAESTNQSLQLAYQAILDTYYMNPHSSFMALHQNKVYGFMKQSFRAGRVKTNGDHTGTATIATEPQSNIYQSFQRANAERRKHVIWQEVLIKKIQHKMSANEVTHEILFDVSDSGYWFEPGDHVSVTPKNSERVVLSILSLLETEAEYVIHLDEQWRSSLLESKQTEISHLSLKEFLTASYLSFISPTEFKRLCEIYKISQLYYEELAEVHFLAVIQKISEYLRTPINALVSLDSYHPYFIGKILRPIAQRQYSVSPVYQQDVTITPTWIKLIITLTHIQPFTERPGYAVKGLASHCLSELDLNQSIAIRKSSSFSFRLPNHVNMPIIMIAAGSGISPFIGFIGYLNQVSCRKAILFYSVRFKEDILLSNEITGALEQGYLEFYIIVTRENIILKYTKDAAIKQNNTSSSKQIDVLLEEYGSEVSRLFVQEQAHVYVCGNIGFSRHVNYLILNLLINFNDWNEERADSYLKEQIADNRYHIESFHSQPSINEETYKLSEIARHNTTSVGYWIIINDQVYDLTNFFSLHPGGQKILRVNAGLDATTDYAIIGHAKNKHITSQLNAYHIGQVNYPTYHQDYQQTWLLFLKGVVEIQNTFFCNMTDRLPRKILFETYAASFVGMLEMSGAFFHVYVDLLSKVYEQHFKQVNSKIDKAVRDYVKKFHDFYKNEITTNIDELEPKLKDIIYATHEFLESSKIIVISAVDCLYRQNSASNVFQRYLLSIRYQIFNFTRRISKILFPTQPQEVFMTQACIIVDAFSTGSYLAAEIHKHFPDIKLIHVRSSDNFKPMYSRSFKGGFSEEITCSDGNLDSILSMLEPYEVLHVIAGTESGVMLADQLAVELGLETANDISLSSARRDKCDMAQALQAAGVAYIPYLKESNIEAMIEWTKQKKYPIVVKPIDSAGTDNFHLCHTEEEVKQACLDILSSKNLFGKNNIAVLAQDYIDGQEYIVNTVSRDGVCYISEVFQVNKIDIAGSRMYDTTILLSNQYPNFRALVEYAKAVIKAVGISHGPAHCEIMWDSATNKPVLIEVAARLMGALDPEYVKTATGTTSIELVVEAYFKPDEFKKRLDSPREYSQKCAYMLDLFSHEKSRLENINVGLIDCLPSFHRFVPRKQPGDLLTITKDIDSSTGLVFLLGDKETQLMQDREIIRRMEKDGSLYSTRPISPIHGFFPSVSVGQTPSAGASHSDLHYRTPTYGAEG